MDERRQEQASALALGVLPEEERFEFERALADDQELKKLVGEFTDALGDAAESLPKVAPSAGLKQRILSEVAEIDRTNGADPGKGVVRAFPVWIPWAAAAGFAVAATLLFLERNSLHSEHETLVAEIEQASSANIALDRERSELAATLDNLNSEISGLRERETTLVAETDRWRSDLEALQTEQAELQAAAESLRVHEATLLAETDRWQADVETLRQERTALERATESLRTELAQAQRAANVAEYRVARLESQDADQPRALAVSLWNDVTHEGLLVVENLTLPPPGKTYQLWVIDPTTKAPIDAGIFTTDASGTGRIIFRPKTEVNNAAQFAVSLEDAGGKPAPEGPIVMIGPATKI